MIDKLLSFVAPHLCSGCAKTGFALCDHCKYDIIRRPFLDCIACGGLSSHGICAHHPLDYSRAWVVGRRIGALEALLDGFKFHNMKSAAGDLASLLDARLPPLSASKLVVVPVPTATAHIRTRGYDHSLLIAQAFALRRGLPVERLLTRQHDLVQHLAGRQSRFDQARTAFRVVGLVDPGVTYLIIDDIITTGATILAASRVLAEAGAGRIWVAAVAYQPLD